MYHPAEIWIQLVKETSLSRIHVILKKLVNSSNCRINYVICSQSTIQYMYACKILLYIVIRNHRAIIEIDYFSVSLHVCRFSSGVRGLKWSTSSVHVHVVLEPYSINCRTKR